MKRVWVGVMLLSLAVAGLAAAGSASRAAASPAPSAQAQQFALAGQKALKLLVDKDGWYRVRFPDLAKAGFAVPKKTANLQLWLNSAQVPILVPRGAIEFYGQALDNDVTDTQVYWLVSGKTKGLRLPVVKAGGPAGTPTGSFGSSIDLAPRTAYNLALLNGDRSNWVGPAVRTGTVTAVKVTTANVNKGASGALKVSLQGFSLVNHVVRVTWNGTVLGTITYKGQAVGTQTFPIPAGSIQEGDNTLNLTGTAGEIDFSNLLSATLSYQHAYVAGGDVLTVKPPAARRVTVGGFTTKNIRVIDVSNPARPRELVPTRAGAVGSFSATFKTPAGSPTLFAFANYKALTPKLVLNAPSTLNSAVHSADLLVISYADFIPALGPLLALRQQEGFQTTVADVQDVYDEFSFGVKDAAAVKAFLVWTKDHWQKAPHYVLFVGDASYDPRNFLNQGSFDFVPTDFEDTQYLQAPSDDSLADFNGDGIPEMAVGRLPVRTVADTSAVVSKLVGYDQATRARSVLLVADKNIDYDFEAQSKTLFGLIPSGVPVSTVYRNQGPTDAAVRSRLITALNQGPTIVNFFGHGSVSIWTSGSILRTQDAAVLTNGGSLSLYLMMTCLNGFFIDPQFTSLGEALVLAPGGGAVATWSSSGETVPTDQVIADQQAVKLLMSTPNLTLGDAMIAGKSVIHDIDVRHTWVLLGDPTTRLH